jgi:hypothetical protein
MKMKSSKRVSYSVALLRIDHLEPQSSEPFETLRDLRYTTTPALSLFAHGSKILIFRSFLKHDRDVQHNCFSHDSPITKKLKLQSFEKFERVVTSNKTGLLTSHPHHSKFSTKSLRNEGIAGVASIPSQKHP